AAWNRGLCNLLLGRWREGWPDYERRWQTEQTAAQWRKCGRPQWSGEQSIRGKTLLLHAEQGHGDTLMALRFVRPVMQMGARVLLGAPPELQPLLGEIDGATLIRPEDLLPAFDLHCPLMSLPWALDVKPEGLAAEVPYLSAPAAHLAKWRQRLPGSGGLKVGINWAGNPTFRHDKSRSIGLPRMLPLVAQPGVQ